jgi:hypothetical protein
MPLTACVSTGPNAASDPTRACLSSLGNDSRFFDLRTKIAINRLAENATLDMLSDGSTVTEAERSALSAWKDARDACIGQGASFRANYLSSEYQNAFGAGQAALNALIARLYNGEITYAQFNRERASLAVNAGASLNSAEQRQREVNAEQSARSRAAFGQALTGTLGEMQNQLIYQQQLQNQQIQQNRIRNTDCTRNFNGGFNCTSY